MQPVPPACGLVEAEAREEGEGVELVVPQLLGDLERALGRFDVVVANSLRDRRVAEPPAVRVGQLERLRYPAERDCVVRRLPPHRAAHRRLERELAVQLAEMSRLRRKLDRLLHRLPEALPV